MIKTSQVAETLNISPKTVLSIAKRLQITPEKNELGHYLFTEQDVLRMSEYVPQNQQRIGFARIMSSEQESKDQSILLERMETVERQVREIDVDILQYQLLQHRREIEELRGMNDSLQVELEALKDQVDSLLRRNVVETTSKKEKNFFSFLFSSKAEMK